MLINFTKMHGLGNDFMVVDTIVQSLNIEDLNIPQLAERHLGIGFDQLLVVQPPKHREADFDYRIFNADGSEVENCGNGARCFAKYVREQGLTWKSSIVVNTKGGLITLQCDSDGGYTVNMGVPRWEPEDLPINAKERMAFYDLGIDNLQGACVSMGNPHCVIRVDSVEKAEVNRIGAFLNQSSLFPEGVNVGFMEILSTKAVKLRVYERGVGETQACGTGACAAAAIARTQGLSEMDVTVHLRGGDLQIRYASEQEVLLMKGPATTVFQGQIDI
ncbi:MAG: diaminopimelate epimerase [Pseudomonadota bacterium]